MTTKLPERHEENLAAQIKSQLQSFGARLRQLRLQKGWTLEELARSVGMSRTAFASIAAALTLTKVFDVSLASLFESHLGAEPCVIVRAGDAAEQEVNGLKYTPLSRAGRFFNLQPIRVKVPRTRKGDEHYRHEGEEWIYLLSGLLTLSLAGKTYDLSPGDAAHFDSRQPHRLIARGLQDAEVLLVASPISNTSPIIAGWQAGAEQQRAIPAPGFINFTSTRKAAGATEVTNPRESEVRISRIIKK